MDVTKEQALSLLRQALIYGGGVLTGRGLIDDATVQISIGIIMWLVPGLWALWERRPEGLMTSAMNARSS